AVADDGATNQGVSLNVNAQNGVLSNDTDPDGDTLHVSAVNGQRPTSALRSLAPTVAPSP
ncbi:hypothetical protein BMR85_029175, partial [Achromobacter sp. KAs 3-5]